MTPLDCFGEFWVPEMSDERLPGLLQFKPDGESSLRVMGQFGLSARTDSDNEPNSYFYNTFGVRIFGTFLLSDAITYQKECVTLEDAHLIDGDKNGMRFQFRRTLLGGHYGSNDYQHDIQLKPQNIANASVFKGCCYVHDRKFQIFDQADLESEYVKDALLILFSLRSAIQGLWKLEKKRMFKELSRQVTA